MEIIYYPDQILMKKATEVLEFNQKLINQVNEMIDLVKKHHGVGLSAPQVGLSKRFFITYIDDQVDTFINPHILETFWEQTEESEGCLSLPSVSVSVKRYQHISIAAQDVYGHFFRRRLSLFSARVFQHEYDHLNGKLILSYASLEEKKRFNEQLSYEKT